MAPWDWFFGRGPSGFGSSSTAEEVTAGIDASHLTAIVTGATSGIGRETARVLALRGASVIIPARTLESGAKVRGSLLEDNPSAKVHAMEMDLSSLSSVEAFARSFISLDRPLNILINNAGVMGCPFQLSKDGIELQFATNHLGHFFLTNLLLDKMKATAKETGVQGRIVNVSSFGHRNSNTCWFHLDTINDQSKYKPFGTYCRTKLANVLHMNKLSSHLQEEEANLTANSLHPGAIVTNINRSVGKNFLLNALGYLIFPIIKSIPQGASTTCYVALHPHMKDVTGKYFSNCNEVTPSLNARDKEAGKKLWDFSVELIEIKFHRPA